MAGAHVGLTAFYASSGSLFGLAIVFAIARTIVRIRHFHRLHFDDYLLFLGVATLIGGTTLLYINFPYTYMGEQVQIGAELPPPDFLTLLVADQKTQEAGVALVVTTIFSFKFSLLFFFRLLLQRTTKWYMRWWWTIFVLLIPSAAVSIFSDFIACPATGDAILLQCVSRAALARENAAIGAIGAIDIATDILLISLPVILLWNVQIRMRKKLALGSIFCLSIFMIACASVRTAVANGGAQTEVSWILLWTEIEACVAVIVVSITAFKTLFTASRRKYRPSDERPLQEISPGYQRFEGTSSLPSYPSKTLQSWPLSSENDAMSRPREDSDSSGEIFVIEGPRAVDTQSAGVGETSPGQVQLPQITADYAVQSLPAERNKVFENSTAG